MYGKDPLDWDRMGKIWDVISMKAHYSCGLCKDDIPWEKRNFRLLEQSYVEGDIFSIEVSYRCPQCGMVTTLKYMINYDHLPLITKLNLYSDTLIDNEGREKHYKDDPDKIIE